MRVLEITYLPSIVRRAGTAAALLAAATVCAARADTPTGWSGFDASINADLPADNLLAPGDAGQTQRFNFEARSSQDFPGVGLPTSWLPGFGTPKPDAFQSVALTPALRLEVGELATGDSQLPIASGPSELQLNPMAQLSTSATATFIGADWKIAPWAGLDVAASRSNSAAAFGVPFRFGVPSVPAANSVSAYVSFGDGWVTSVSFDDGRTQLDLLPNELALASDMKDAHSIDLGVSKSGLLGSDAFGVSLVRPTQLNNSFLLGPQVSLSSATPETDVQLNYETTFDSNITLEANAGYQMNIGGQPGMKAISVLSRAKINF